MNVFAMCYELTTPTSKWLMWHYCHVIYKTATGKLRLSICLDFGFENTIKQICKGIDWKGKNVSNSLPCCSNLFRVITKIAVQCHEKHSLSCFETIAPKIAMQECTLITIVIVCIQAAFLRTVFTNFVGLICRIYSFCFAVNFYVTLYY